MKLEHPSLIDLGDPRGLGFGAEGLRIGAEGLRIEA